MEEVYTPKEVAEQLKLPLKTVLNYLRTAKLPGFKVGKHWRIRASDLEAFMKPSLRR
jgi:excisionase family DNA binding protein